MFVGGYQIIDLKEVAIDDVSGANIAGLYDKIEGADLKKPILLTGVNDDGTLLGDRFVTFTVSGTIFYAVLDTVYTGSSISSHVLKVESDDDVSIITQVVVGVTTPAPSVFDFNGVSLSTTANVYLSDSLAQKIVSAYSNSNSCFVRNVTIDGVRLPDQYVSLQKEGSLLYYFNFGQAITLSGTTDVTGTISAIKQYIIKCTPSTKACRAGVAEYTLST